MVDFADCAPGPDEPWDDATQVLWEKDCLRFRGHVLTGKHRHWCEDWDGLPVDDTCPEWPCICYRTEPWPIV